MPPPTLNSEEPLICLCLVSLGLVTVARRIGSVVGLAVGGVVLRLGGSVRVLDGIMPMLSVGIGLTGATCIARAVTSLPGVGGLIRLGGRRVCCMLSAMRLLVAAQGVPGRSFLLGGGRRVGGAVRTLSCPGGCHRGRGWNQRAKRRACRRWKSRSARCGPTASPLEAFLSPGHRGNHP